MPQVNLAAQETMDDAGELEDLNFRASEVMTMRNARLRQPCAWCGRELVGIKHQVIGLLHFCDNANECAAQYAIHIPGDTDYAI